MKKLKLLQGNLHRSRIADDLLLQLTLELNIDLVLISEQYTNINKHCWYMDNLSTAAIWILNRKEFRVKNHGSEDGFVWVNNEEITFVSCYFTPNESLGSFLDKLNCLEDFIRKKSGTFVIGGDFNAKAPDWGMKKLDTRGFSILEMAARIGLTVANQGNTPTFRRPGYAETIPDIILVSENLAGHIETWEVKENYTGSDHQYIAFTISKKINPYIKQTTRKLSWNLNKLNREVFKETISVGCDELAIVKNGRTQKHWLKIQSNFSIKFAISPCPGKNRTTRGGRFTGGQPKLQISGKTVFDLGDEQLELGRRNAE
ncbi:uncharacterized protein LOC122505061 [Leptopilina heterotoma]|uniref:uncharacterized protein LOC122505061 n=1 Tax=Leptopilina heterotoma TaxID=63436 RepID=UPI001CA9946C|nr:uncharacterized protein LOC122505061 [Leptopilina heterotoma]